MGYLLDKLDQASLTNQQDVVRNERRQSIENSPYGIVEEGVFHLLFPKSHPYYADVMGSHADIQAAKLEDVRNFFKLYYAPNNASLAIVGDFDTAQAKQLVEKYFGPLKRGAPVPKIAAVTPPITAERRAVIHDQVELPRVYMAWLTPPIFKPGDADADIAADILGGGKSSRLYKKLVYDKQIALDVSASQQSLVLGSVFEIVVTARPGHTAEEMEKAIDEELAAFRKDGPTAEELERARNGTETRNDSGPRAPGRLRRRGRPPEPLQPLPRQSRLSSAGPAPLPIGHARIDSRVRGSATEADCARGRLRHSRQAGPRPGRAHAAKPAEGAEHGRGSGQCRRGVARESAKPGPARPLNLPVPEIFKLSNGLTVYYHYRPGLAGRGGESCFQYGQRRESHRQARPCELHGEHAAAGNGDAERHADCRRSGAAGHGAFLRRDYGFL